MIDGTALAEFSDKFDPPYDDVIESFYRRELELLLERGQLKPARNVNVVFFTDETSQIRRDDIVVNNVLEKLKNVARQLGRV